MEDFHRLLIIHYQYFIFKNKLTTLITRKKKTCIKPYVTPFVEAYIPSNTIVKPITIAIPFDKIREKNIEWREMSNLLSISTVYLHKKTLNKTNISMQMQKWERETKIQIWTLFKHHWQVLLDFACHYTKLQLCMKVQLKEIQSLAVHWESNVFLRQHYNRWGLKTQIHYQF